MLSLLLPSGYMAFIQHHIYVDVNATLYKRQVPVGWCKVFCGGDRTSPVHHTILKFIFSVLLESRAYLDVFANRTLLNLDPGDVSKIVCFYTVH